MATREQNIPENTASPLHLAAEYVQTNASLREAVGLRPEDDAALRPLGEGEHNQNYLMRIPVTGQACVLRINVAPQPFHKNQVAYEHAALTLLEPSGCTPRPLYLDDSPQAPGKGAMAITFCEGEQLDFDNLRPGDLQCAAQLMADVHTVPIPNGHQLYQPVDPLRALFDECLERFRIYQASTCEVARITRWAEAFLHAAQEALDTTGPAADRRHLINTETLPSHFLIPAQAAAEAHAAKQNRATGRFCARPGAFIDWERPIIGEPAQDVAYFVSSTTTYWDSEFLFPAEDADAFVEDYWRAVDGRFPRANFDERFRAFRIMTALRSMTWCCRALLTYGANAASTATATHTTEKTARKLPIYLSDEFLERIAKDVFEL